MCRFIQSCCLIFFMCHFVFIPIHLPFFSHQKLHEATGLNQVIHHPVWQTLNMHEHQSHGLCTLSMLDHSRAYAWYLTGSVPLRVCLGGSARMTQYFRGNLAGLMIRTGKLENKKVIDCLYTCKEGLDVQLPEEVASAVKVSDVNVVKHCLDSFGLCKWTDNHTTLRKWQNIFKLCEWLMSVLQCYFTIIYILLLCLSMCWISFYFYIFSFHLNLSVIFICAFVILVFIINILILI